MQSIEISIYRGINGHAFSNTSLPKQTHKNIDGMLFALRIPPILQCLLKGTYIQLL